MQNAMDQQPAPELSYGSSTARALAVAWLMTIAYLSLTPLEGWQDRGLSPWQFLSDGFPRYWTWTETIGNFAIYLVLALLVSLSLYPHRRGASGAALSVLACGAVSFSIEALQSFNPARYPQLLDWLLNSLGALAGALLAWRFTERILVHGWIRQLGRRWLQSSASLGVLLICLWPILSYFPQHQLFATGRIVDSPAHVLPGSLAYTLLQAQFGPIIASEVLGIAFGVLACACVCFEVLRSSTPRLAFLVCWVALACCIRTLAVSISSHGLPPLGWLTVNAQLGILLGVFAAIGLLRVPTALRSLLSLLGLLVSVVFSNLLPYNAYHAVANLPWSTPAWNNLRATMDLAALIWPYAAMVFMVYRMSSSRAHPR